MKYSSKILLCIFASILATSSIAEDDFKGQIKARQSVMQLLAYNNGILGAMAKGKMPYDADLAQTAASNLVLITTMNNNSMWPKGSDLTASDDTVAKAGIWSNMADFGGNFGKLKTGAKKLKAQAGKGLAELKMVAGEFGKNCGGCHKKFKAKR